MSTALSIKGKTQANDAVTSTINYVNPNATNEQLQSLASAMNALTTNTIVDVTRIDKNSLTATVTKLPRNAYLTLQDQIEHVTSIKYSEVSQSIDEPTAFTLHCDGTFNDKEVTYSGTALGMFINAFATGDTNGTIFLVKMDGTMDRSDIKITIPENETYQSAELTLTVTAE